MPGLSHRKTVAFCELLSDTLKVHLDQFPHLVGESQDLDELLGDLKGLSNEQQALKGRSREISRLRLEAEQRSQELRSRIVAQLQGKLGFSNETLLAFGVNPRKTTRRRATLPPEEGPEVAPEAAGKEAQAPSTGE